MAKMKISRFQKYSPTFSFQSLQIMNIVTIFINIAVWFLAFLHFFFKFESIIPKFAVWFASVRRISVSGPKMCAIQAPEPAIRRTNIRRIFAEYPPSAGYPPSRGSFPWRQGWKQGRQCKIRQFYSDEFNLKQPCWLKLRVISIN